ncbi:hypothetical protein QMK33_08675 [Hymenobacter sp. H14-R3]|uniref:hypothetical protein n=1 Tax=Hymenobacter sp. H14-R3 TaxID=3046308 RepID=UPI0024B9E4D0|nr:hypothetical protein [Hymenobacter sp. H14-R3]MDJ0365225.1 hypothetical protein [Hymenobacter sp. H14-R3]
MVGAYDINSLGLDLSDFKIVWVDNVPFFVPKDMDVLEEKYLFASQLTLMFSQKSVDNVLKNYLSGFEESRSSITSSQEEILIEGILNISKQTYNALHKKLSDINFGEGTVSTIACNALFFRLAPTFRAIHYCINFYYYFEGFSLIRLVLEQLAYAYTASQVASGKFKTFVSPTKSVGILKNLLPNAGRLYNVLSKKAHIDKSEIHNYIKIENEQHFVLLHDINYALEASAYLLLVLDLMNCTFEYCFKNYGIHFENTFLDRNKAVFLKEDRDFRNLANSKIAQIELLLKMPANKLMRA